MSDPLHIIVDDFGIWLLDHRIEFRCLFIPKRKYKSMYFKSTVWLRRMCRWIFCCFIERMSAFKLREEYLTFTCVVGPA